MLLDIFIAVGLAVVMLGTAYLGVRVTIHGAESDRSRKLHKIAFWGLGGIAVILIVIQTTRNASTQSGLQRQLSRIQRNTEQPPRVQVTNTVPPAQVVIQSQLQPTPSLSKPAKVVAAYNNDLRVVRFERSPYEAGKPVFINTYLRYDGENPARFRGYYKVVVVHMKEGDATPDKLTEVENSLWDNMVKGMQVPDHGMMISPKSNFWVTLNGPLLTTEQVEELQTRGSGAVLFIGEFRWVDGIGDYELDFCSLVQSNPEVFIGCSGHNGPVRIKK